MLNYFTVFVFLVHECALLAKTDGLHGDYDAALFGGCYSSYRAQPSCRVTPSGTFTLISTSKGYDALLVGGCGADVGDYAFQLLIGEGFNCNRYGFFSS